MTEIALVGGFSSSSKQYDSLAAQLQDYYGVETVGVNFSHAIAHLEELAETIDQRMVIAHSAGTYAVAHAMKFGARPAELTSIAPPIPELVRSLVWRGATLGHRLPPTEPVEGRKHEFTSREELTRHPILNFSAIPKLGHFASLHFAQWAAHEGTAVRLAFMQQDGLFNLANIEQATIDAALHSGVDIRQLEGYHTRFTSFPIDVLEEIEEAPLFTAEQPEQQPVVTLRERILLPIGTLSLRTFGRTANG